MHDSRTSSPSLKPKLLAPKLPAVEDQSNGLGFLSWMGIICLIGGGVVVITCGICCYIRACGARTSLWFNRWAYIKPSCPHTVTCLCDIFQANALELPNKFRRCAFICTLNLKWAGWQALWKTDPLLLNHGWVFFLGGGAWRKYLICFSSCFFAVLFIICFVFFLFWNIEHVKFRKLMN